MTAPRNIIRKPAVRKATGLSDAQIWRKSRDPSDDFPESIVLGPNSCGFYEDEISAWIDSRPRGVVPWKNGLREYQGQRGQEPEQPEPEVAES